MRLFSLTGLLALLAVTLGFGPRAFAISLEASPSFDDVTEITVSCKCSSSFRQSGFDNHVVVFSLNYESAWHCTEGNWIRADSGIPGIPSHEWILVEGCEELPGPWLTGCEFQGSVSLYDPSDLTNPLGGHGITDSLNCGDFRFVHVGTQGGVIAPGSGPTAGVYGLICSACESAESLPE